MSKASHSSTTPLRSIDRIGDGLTQLCLAIAAVALICIVAINGTNVVARYLFNAPFSWAEEMMLYLMILSVFSGAIAVTWRNLHIRIDTFIERAPPAVRRAALNIGTIVSLVVMVSVIFASGRIVTLLYSYDQRSEALAAPVWIPQSFVPIGLGIMALIMAAKLVTSRFYAEPPANSAKEQP